MSVKLPIRLITLRNWSGRSQATVKAQIAPLLAPRMVRRVLRRHVDPVLADGAREDFAFEEGRPFELAVGDALLGQGVGAEGVRFELLFRGGFVLAERRGNRQPQSEYAKRKSHESL